MSLIAQSHESRSENLFMIERKVPFDQRQGAFADRAEADHHDGAVETGEQC